MTAALRQALDVVSDGPLLREMTRHNAADFAEAMPELIEAARSWLNLLEGDEGIVEKIEDALVQAKPFIPFDYATAAQVVLAAIVGEDKP